MTTVRLWQAWISAGVVAVLLHRPDDAVELPGRGRAAGKKKCQEMLTLSAVSASFAMTSW